MTERRGGMRKYKPIIIIVLLFVVFGCSSIKVSQDYDPAKDFSGLKTYAWQSETQAKTDDVRVDNPLLNARIRAAFDRSISRKGYQKVSDGTPDFHVSYQYTIRKTIGSDDVSTGIGFGIGGFGHRSGAAGGIGIGTGSSVSEYDEGMLVIDFIDAGNGNLIWRGIGTRRVSMQSDPEKTITDINKTVDEILAQFPPKRKR